MESEVGRKLGMPANQFIDTAYARTIGGEYQLFVGILGPLNESSDNNVMREPLGNPLGA